MGYLLEILLPLPQFQVLPMEMLLWTFLMKSNKNLMTGEKYGRVRAGLKRANRSRANRLDSRFKSAHVQPE